MPGRLMLLDSPSLYFRAFYGVPSSVRAPSGEPVNAVRGFLDMTATLISRFRPTSLVATMDHDWRPAFRVALVPSYKTHRLAPEGEEEVPDDLSPQVPILESVLDAVGIAVLGAPECEADDVIGTLCTRHDGPVDVVTGDRDLFQLVDDARGRRVLYTQKGIAQIAIVDEAAVEGRYGIPGQSYADFALLRGDPSDGLPGVPGVGEKTAARLISSYGSVEALYRALESSTPAGMSATLRAKVLAAKPYVDAARVVVDVRRDAPLAEVDATLPTVPRDPDELMALAERWGIASACSRLVDALAR